MSDGRKMNYIKNLYLSQVLGHNRTDITAVYKKKKNSIEDAISFV
jgi:hypothetical protein